MQQPSRSEVYHNMPDEQVVVLARQGDDIAYAVLTVRYVYLVKCRAALYSGSEVELEDLMQEGMIGLMRAVRTYREGQGAEFATYARVCIDNSILSSLRSARVAKRIPSKSLVSIDEAVKEEARPWKERLAANKADNPESIFIAKEEQKRMEERLNIILSPLERNALFLYLSGCNYEEIGRHLSTTPKTVDNALQRVRRKLKQKQSS